MLCSCFRWEIFNPFLPWRTLEAFFLHGSPTLCQWKATFRSMNRSLDPLEFSFYLALDPSWGARNEVVVDKILITILLNGRCIATRRVPNFRFNNGNQFTYNFQDSTAVVYPQTEPHHLVIRIEIIFSGSRSTEGETLIFDDEDLNSLSNALESLQANPQYFNLTLEIEDTPHSFKVHTYIMDKRWEKFGKLYPDNALNKETITTNMSFDILRDILIYVYSGKVKVAWPDWTKVDYVAELFQVIFRYKLYHLYKVFVKDDLLQVRLSRTNGLINSKLYPLVFRNGRFESITSMPWPVNPGTEYQFMIQMYVENDDRSRPWLSYYMRSLSNLRLNVRVCLDLTRQIGDNFQRVATVHRKDFSFDRKESVESGPVLFLGGPEISCLSSSDAHIRCFLSITDGTTIEQLHSFGNEDTKQSDAERFDVLSNHMHELRKNKGKMFDDSCMFISKSTENDLGSEEAYIHKAIFACRVPEYWKELEGFVEGDELVETVHCSLSEEAVIIVIDYIYTGKVFDIPLNLLEEIRRFALRTNFHALLRRVDSIRDDRD